jgi:hypothetical protein
LYKAPPLWHFDAASGRGDHPITYELTVDDFGEEFGFVYVSHFRAVAKLQRHENARLKTAKSTSLVPAPPA